MKSWIIPAGTTTGPSALRLVTRETVVPGVGEVKIAMKAWSTNYRDLAITAGHYFNGPLARDTVPFSDGAGEIVAVGEGVTNWREGDRVLGCFFQNWLDGPPLSTASGSDLGATLDGVLAEEVVLSAQGLVRIPDYLSYKEAATLPCAGVTAWNALFVSHQLKAGQTVLVLGTGGVSIFALQFAKMAGARVIVTSSSDDKLAHASKLGADGTINYRTTPDWDVELLRLTEGRGADLVVEVGGIGTLQKSAHAVAFGGTIALIGVLTGVQGTFNPMPLMRKAACLKGVFVGSRAMFEAMNQALVAHHIHPVIDRVFGFDQAADALAYQAAAGHFGKVVISVA